jgi:hypothetical protein
MRKGIVMARKGKRLVVLTPEGEFKHVRENGVKQSGISIGEEIEWNKSIVFPRLVLNPKWAAAATILLIVILLPPVIFISKPAVAAIVTLDTNPVVEMKVDSKGKVLSLRGFDNEGKQLLSSTENLVGRPVANVVVTLIKKAEMTHPQSAPNEVVISTTSLKQNVNEAHLQKAIKRELEKTETGENQPIQVGVMSVPQEIRNQALKEGVSPSIYALWEEAKQNGEHLDLEELKKTPVSKLMEEINRLKDENLVKNGKPNQDHHHEKKEKPDKDERKRQNQSRLGQIQHLFELPASVPGREVKPEQKNNRLKNDDNKPQPQQDKTKWETKNKDTKTQENGNKQGLNERDKSDHLSQNGHADGKELSQNPKADEQKGRDNQGKNDQGKWQQNKENRDKENKIGEDSRRENNKPVRAGQSNLPKHDKDGGGKHHKED